MSRTRSAGGGIYYYYYCYCFCCFYYYCKLNIEFHASGRNNIKILSQQRYWKPSRYIVQNDRRRHRRILQKIEMNCLSG